MAIQKTLFSHVLYKTFASKWISMFQKTLFANGISYQLISGTNDIWLRDFMPVRIRNNKYVQFSLTKNYYLRKDRHKLTDPAPICKSLGIDPIVSMLNNGIPIYLDGGNVILNPSKTKAIITEKVFDDNEIPRQGLERLLKKVLEVEQVIFIPVEDGDDTGHSDGMVRFVDDHTVVANDYANIDVSQSFKDRFYSTLSDAGFKVLLVPYNPVYERFEGYWVATGCYINYLHAGTKVLLPTFDDPVNDENAIQRFGEVFGPENIIPVPSLEVSRGGGVLNCLSWECF